MQGDNISNATLRAKVRVYSVMQSKAADGSTENETVVLVAVYGEKGSENAEWAKYTPSARFEITINNPDAIGKLSKGSEYFIDFIPAVPNN